jgi:hypothetical protein
MEDFQRRIVRDHIADLHREADARRAAGRYNDPHPEYDSDDDVGAARATHRSHAASPVRVRFGHWLIGLGAAVAGPERDHADSATRHAA